MTASFDWRNRWLFLALAAVVLLAFLGSRGLNEPDEGRYAEIGREMAATGEWRVPHLNGFEHFQKPPLLYWMTAVSLRLLGVHEWAARLPSALAALGAILLTAWIGKTLFHPTTGLVAGAMLLSSAGFFALARLLTPDMLLTFWITAAIACFLKYALGGGRRRWAYLFFVVLGCGFLSKGPMAFVVPLAAVITWQVRQKESPALPWGRGMLLTLGVSLSWFIALSVWRHDLFDYFWRYELLERFASSSHGRSKPFWFFFPVILVGTVPWVFLFPKLAAEAWRRLRARTVPAGGWLLLGWTVVPFLVLSLSGSKLPTYILPLLPALALGFAWLITRDNRPARWFLPVLGAAVLLWLIGAALVPSFNDRLGPQGSVRDLIRPIARNPVFATTPVYAVEVRAHGLEFYLQRLVAVTREQADIVLKPNPEQQQRLLSTAKFSASSIDPGARGSSVLVLVRRQRAERTFPADRWQALGQAGDFVLLQSRSGTLVSESAKK